MNRHIWYKAVIAFTIVSMASSLNAEPLYESSLVEPLNKAHNHGSCVVELPNGDILVSWYKGSGERTADDVRIVGARLRQGEKKWPDVFDMADFPGFPDCNSAMVLDKTGKLWLFWPLIVANRWETAILMSRRTTWYRQPGAPVWQWQSPILFDPGDKFASAVNEGIEKLRPSFPEEFIEKHGDEVEELKQKAADKYARRMGWMPRSKATVLENGRILLPLYSDGFSFSLVAISDDNGETWNASSPIISLGGVQPSIISKRDGTLVAFLRDNGPPPKRIIRSVSTDRGMTWSIGEDTDLPDPGAGVEALRLENGDWLLVNNDTEEERHSLAARISEDDGASWRWIRHIELWERGKGSACYPSLALGSDGTIHGSYSYKTQDQSGETIKYVHFNEDWVKDGDRK